MFIIILQLLLLCGSITEIILALGSRKIYFQTVTSAHRVLELSFCFQIKHHH